MPRVGRFGRLQGEFLKLLDKQFDTAHVEIFRTILIAPRDQQRKHHDNLERDMQLKFLSYIASAKKLSDTAWQKEAISDLEVQQRKVERSMRRLSKNESLDRNDEGRFVFRSTRDAGHASQRQRLQRLLRVPFVEESVELAIAQMVERELKQRKGEIGEQELVDIYRYVLSVINDIILQPTTTPHPTKEDGEKASKLRLQIDRNDDAKELEKLIAEYRHTPKIDPHKRMPEQERATMIDTMRTVFDVTPEFESKIHRAVKLFFPSQYKEAEVSDAIHGKFSNQQPSKEKGEEASQFEMGLLVSFKQHYRRKHRKRMMQSHHWAMESDGNSNITGRTTEAAGNDFRGELVSRLIELTIEIKRNIVSEKSVVGERELDDASLHMQACLNKFKRQGQRNYYDAASSGLEDALEQFKKIVDQLDQTAIHLLVTEMKIIGDDLRGYADELEGKTDKETIRYTKSEREMELEGRAGENNLKGKTVNIKFSEYMSRKIKFIKNTYFNTVGKNAAVRSELSLLQNQSAEYGISLAKGDLRQKSYTHTAVLNTIFNEMSRLHRYKRISMRVRECIEKTKIFECLIGPDETYQNLDSSQKEAILRNLMDGSDESRVVLDWMNDPAHLETRKNDLGQHDPLIDELTVAVTEIRRHNVASRFRDIELNIVSNVEADYFYTLLQGELFLHMNGTEKEKVTVPLFESNIDLKHAKQCLEKYVRFRIQLVLETLYKDCDPKDRENFRTTFEMPPEESVANLMADGKRFQNALKKNSWLRKISSQVFITAFLGYSDSERESGIGALVSAQVATEALMDLYDEYGLERDIFHGGGGHKNRKGARYVFAHKTFQGDENDLHFGSKPKALRTLGRQFSHAVTDAHAPTEHRRMGALPKYLQDALWAFEAAQTKVYESYYDESQFGPINSVFMGRTGFWFIDIALNSSSRSTTVTKKSTITGNRFARVKMTDGGIGLKTPIERTRAISKNLLDELLQGMIHLTGGVRAGLAAVEAMQTISVSAANTNVKVEKTGRDVLLDMAQTAMGAELIEKAAIGYALADFSLIRSVLFEDFVMRLQPGTAEREEAETFLNPDEKTIRVGAEACRDALNEDLKEAATAFPDKVGNGAKPITLDAMRELHHFTCMLEEDTNKGREKMWGILRELYPERMPVYFLDVEGRDVGKDGKWCKLSKNMHDPMDLLSPWPEYKRQLESIRVFSEPARERLAEVIRQVNQGKNLEEIFGSSDNVDGVMSDLGAAVSNTELPGYYEPSMFARSYGQARGADARKEIEAARRVTLNYE